MWHRQKGVCICVPTLGSLGWGDFVPRLFLSKGVVVLTQYLYNGLPDGTT